MTSHCTGVFLERENNRIYKGQTKFCFTSILLGKSIDYNQQNQKIGQKHNSSSRLFACNALFAAFLSVSWYIGCMNHKDLDSNNDFSIDGACTAAALISAHYDTPIS